MGVCDYTRLHIIYVSVYVCTCVVRVRIFVCVMKYVICQGHNYHDHLILG